MPLSLLVGASRQWGESRSSRGSLLGSPGHDTVQLADPLLPRVDLGLPADEVGEVDVDLPRKDLFVMAADLL